MDPITLVTDRLLLRPAEPGDVDAVLAACQDPGIQRWLPVPSPYEREHAEEYVLKIIPAGWREDRQYDLVLTGLESGALVGSAGVGRTAGPEERVRSVGFWTAPGHRGQGYAGEAVSALARWAFAELGADRLEWLAQVGNEGSRSVARKAGFTMEGVLRSRLVHRGVRRDAWVASLLPSDLGLAPRVPYEARTARGAGAAG